MDTGAKKNNFRVMVIHDDACHFSEEEAREMARQLASKNRGERYGVYKIVSIYRPKLRQDPVDAEVVDV